MLVAETGPFTTPEEIKETDGAPAIVADTTLLLMPSCCPSVRTAKALPSPSVVLTTDDAPSSMPPPFSTLNVTAAPETGLPPVSFTITTKGSGRGDPTPPF